MSQKLSGIYAGSEHAKLCKKLLECVVDSTDLISSAKDPEEVVERIEEDDAVSEAANVVVTRVDTKEDNEYESKSEPDYENLVSDKELNVEVAIVDENNEEAEPMTCRSPFEEHKQELIAGLKELKPNIFLSLHRVQ